MEALKASYGESSSDSNTDDLSMVHCWKFRREINRWERGKESVCLPLPLVLLNSIGSTGDCYADFMD